MNATVIRSEHKGWYIEVKFKSEFQKWAAYFFDKDIERVVSLSDSERIFDTPEEALAFARSEVDCQIEEEEISESFSNLIDQMLAKGHSPCMILRGLGGAIPKKNNELGIDGRELQDHLWDAAVQAPGWEE